MMMDWMEMLIFHEFLVDDELRLVLLDVVIGLDLVLKHKFYEFLDVEREWFLR